MPDHHNALNKAAHAQAPLSDASNIGRNSNHQAAGWAYCTLAATHNPLCETISYGSQGKAHIERKLRSNVPTVFVLMAARAC